MTKDEAQHSRMTFYKAVFKQKNKHEKDYVNWKDLLYIDFVMQEVVLAPA